MRDRLTRKHEHGSRPSWKGSGQRCRRCGNCLRAVAARSGRRPPSSLQAPTRMWRQRLSDEYTCTKYNGRDNLIRLLVTCVINRCRYSRQEAQQAGSFVRQPAAFHASGRSPQRTNTQSWTTLRPLPLRRPLYFLPVLPLGTPVLCAVDTPLADLLRGRLTAGQSGRRRTE